KLHDGVIAGIVDGDGAGHEPEERLVLLFIPFEQRNRRNPYRLLIYGLNPLARFCACTSSYDHQDQDHERPSRYFANSLHLSPPSHIPLIIVETHAHCECMPERKKGPHECGGLLLAA